MREEKDFLKNPFGKGEGLTFLWVNKQDYHSPKSGFYPLGVRREVG